MKPEVVEIFSEVMMVLLYLILDWMLLVLIREMSKSFFGMFENIIDTEKREEDDVDE